ncbi:hypothetical protein PF008_g24458 [Phytophthora fragariae]|uniref:NrS-1 polymerase-like helicase domain-containing protein n=1 Tax=Phytophthora fragariae TaxID=53985 RepID=A0A6G0QNM9_9STRA|nr:hypothetical protein PF008_g24458 [Phytophthora fragariae]
MEDPFDGEGSSVVVKSKKVKADNKLYKFLSCLKQDRFTVSAERSPLLGIAVAVRDYSKVPNDVAYATLNKVVAEMMGKICSASVATAWSWSSQNRSKDLTMASINQYAKADDPDAYRDLKTKKLSDDEKSIDAKLMESISDELAKLPKRLIRERNEWTQNSLILTERWNSPKELAYAIKSSYAYINNSSQAYFLKKEINQVRFSDRDVVDVVAYAKHKASSRDCNEKSVNFKVKFVEGDETESNDDNEDDWIDIKLDAILTTNWRQLAYSDAQVIPYLPTETPTIGHTFNMFGDYQHKYHADFKIDQDLVNLWLHHIRDTICNGDLNCYEYLVSWFAHIIQKPKVKTKICPLIKSRPGSGKGFTFSVFNQYVLNPQQTLVVNDLDRLTGRFNSLAIGKMLIVCDEALDSKNRKSNQIMKNRKSNQIMKNRISESTQVVEEKYSNAIEVNDFSNYAILTNNDFQSIVEQGDRRYLCLLASDHRGPYNEGSEGVLGHDA